MGKLLPILLAVLGLAAGAGGGYVLRPEPAPQAEQNPCGPAMDEKQAVADDSNPAGGMQDHAFVKLDNQFIIPLVQDSKVAAMVVLAITLEVTEGEDATVYKHEPKIRDEFLQVMFNHANSGGFDGVFTDNSKLTMLRRALLEVATEILGDTVHDVLIASIVRQDN